MTGLETILHEILEDSRGKARSVLEDAKKKAQEQLCQAQENLDILEKEARQTAEEKAKDILERSASAAQGKGRRLVLEKKQALIDQVLDAVYQSLLQMNDAAYEEFVLRQLESYPKEEKGLLCFVPRKGELVSDTLEKELEKQHPGFAIDQEPLKGDGGFLLAIGRIELDMTYRALLHENLEELRDMAHRILFEQGAV